MDAVLVDDVRSIFKDGRCNIVYGVAGEKLRVISDHGNVVIVEKAGGVRFPALKSDIKCS